MGKKIAGTIFITLILVIFSMFKDRAMISREPTQVISPMTVSFCSSGARKAASREMLP